MGTSLSSGQVIKSASVIVVTGNGERRIFTFAGDIEVTLARQDDDGDLVRARRFVNPNRSKVTVSVTGSQVQQAVPVRTKNQLDHAAVISDWLEERGHSAAAQELRTGFEFGA